ncbi:hypothetical protein EC396_03815 [Lutibacter sp. HS1-25]|nr:hypothetical protein EC396_03815 [Lutibacter sp. HS1-25]
MCGLVKAIVNIKIVISNDREKSHKGGVFSVSNSQFLIFFKFTIIAYSYFTISPFGGRGNKKKLRTFVQSFN